MYSLEERSYVIDQGVAGGRVLVCLYLDCFYGGP